MIKASMAPSPLPQPCGHELPLAPLPLLKILDQPLQPESKQSHSSYNAGISTKSMGTPKVTCTQYSLGTVKEIKMTWSIYKSYGLQEPRIKELMMLFSVMFPWRNFSCHWWLHNPHSPPWWCQQLLPSQCPWSVEFRIHTPHSVSSLCFQ